MDIAAGANDDVRTDSPGARRRPALFTLEIRMTERIQHHGLQVAANLNQFIEREALPGTGLDVDGLSLIHI